MSRQKKQPTLFMETTKIDPEKTVSEIQKVLGEYGASAILINYENGEVSSVSFKIVSGNAELPFILPCRYEPVFQILVSRKKRICGKNDYRSQAKRVAWRQILRWIEAQLALTSTKMVKIEEVFLPYLQNAQGKTLFEALSENKYKLLESK